MRRKRKRSGQEVLQMLRRRKGQNDMETFQDHHQQSVNHQSDDHFQNENITNSACHDDTFDPSLSRNEVQPDEKEEPLLVKVKDTCTGEFMTRKMVAKQVWHLEKTKKIIVELNGHGQGNNRGANLLVRFLGQVAQKSEFCPLSVTRWDLMPEQCSIDQWKCIEDHFEFDYAVGIKWARSSLGDRWKAYKYRLRCRHFYPNKSKEDILANPPPGVNSTEWTAFVHHYKNAQMKKQSEQNTSNRKKVKATHGGGSKSNARRGRQMELELGRPICRSEVKLSTLLKKDGNYVNGEGKAMADKILESISVDQERAATVGVPSKINAYPDDAIGKMYGAEHSGRVRCFGPGVCPTNVFRMRRHFTDFIQVGSSSQKNVDDLHKQVEILGEKLIGYEETKEQLTQTTEKLTQTQNQLARLQAFLLHKFGDKFGDELSIFNQKDPPS